MLDVVALVTSTTVYLLTERTSDQADEIAKYIVDRTIDFSSWSCNMGGQHLSSGRHEEGNSVGSTELVER